jgi:hypothetical protein
MNERELKILCSNKNSEKGILPWLYWSSELYSFGKYIRKYGYYPSFLPLAVYSDHSGPSFSDVPYLHEKETRAPVFLAHRKIKVENYINITKKRAYTLYSPSVFYRQLNSIEQEEKAQGTICFPVHSLPNSGFEFNVNKYCEDLKTLPKEFQPVIVCLHMHDINNDTFKQYKENGIDVVTAGNTSDGRFVERLYDIIKQAKFISSNNVSTITFLSVEMRIPFFIYGDKENTINVSDKNFSKGIIKEPNHKQFDYLKSRLVISKDYKVANYDKKIIFEVESALGLYDGISRQKMFFVLYAALFLWVVKLEWVFWLRSKIKK